MKNASMLFTAKDHTSVAIRVAGLFVPILFSLYGVLIEQGLFPRHPQYFGATGLIIVSIIWIAMGVYQLAAPSKTQQEFILRISLYHVMATLFVLYVTGFYTPLTALWLILLIASYIRVGFQGAIMSAALLALLGLLDALLFKENAYKVISNNILVLATTIVTSSISMILIDGKIRDHNELTAIKDKEELQHNQIETIINTLAEAVVSTDREGTLITYNAAFLSLLDTNQSIIGNQLDKLFAFKDTSNNSIRIRSILENIDSTFVRNDICISNPDDPDDIIRLEVTISPVSNAYSNVKNNSIRGFVIILRDVTKSRSLEEEKDEFISVVSHELRTPLTVAEGTLSNTMEMMKRNNIPKSILEPSITMAHSQVLFLAKMVNDLSTLSRAERGVGDEIEDIDVKAIAESMYNEYLPQATQHNLAFNIDVPVRPGTVTTSRLYLAELLQNFITNAIKYTREGSITLRVKRNASDKTVTFSVTDTGIGISKHDQMKIFEKFYRSEDYRTRETGGTGLGLYVAQKLARKIDTTIEMRSRLNHGSTFSITLPLKTKPAVKREQA